LKKKEKGRRDVVAQVEGKRKKGKTKKLTPVGTLNGSNGEIGSTIHAGGKTETFIDQKENIRTREDIKETHTP